MPLLSLRTGPHRRRAHAVVVAMLLVGAACAPGGARATCTGTVVQLRHAETLTAGVDLAYPPFAFDDPSDDEPTGFEVELLREVAKAMGLKLLLVSRTTGALIPGAIAHRHDVAASGLRNTDELASQACLSNPYLDADLGIVAMGEEPVVRGEGDLAGRRVGVIEGSQAQTWALERLGQTPSLRSYGAPEDLVSDLRSGAIDAAIDDLPVALHRQLTMKELRVVDTLDLDSRYVFAASPDNAALVKVVNDALAELAADGKLAELSERWFGTEL